MSSRRPGTGTFVVLDAMRGIAALLIAMRHVEPFFGAIPFGESFLAVDLFFLLSGTVICHAYEGRLRQGLSVPRFMWIRAVRIYPLYLLGSAVGVLNVVLRGDVGPLELAGRVGLGLLLLPDLVGDSLFSLNGPAWSLFLEVWVNLAYALAVRHLTTRRLLLLLGCTAPVLAACVATSAEGSLDLGWTRDTILVGVPRVAFSFFAGVLIHRIHTAYAAPAVLRSSVLPWILLLVVAAVLVAAPPPSIRPAYDLVACCVLFPVLVYAALPARPPAAATRLFGLAGRLSYPVYALHVPVAVLVGRVVAAATARPAEAFAPALGFVFLPLFCALCLLLDRRFDGPLRRWLLRRSERSRVPVF